MRLVARRHELGYMRDGARVTASLGFHERIARALRAGDRDRARAARGALADLARRLAFGTGSGLRRAERAALSPEERTCGMIGTRSVACALAAMGLAAILATAGAAQDGSAPSAAPGAAACAEQLRDAVRANGAAAGKALMQELQRTRPAAADSARKPIINLAVEEFQSGQRETGIGMLEAAKAVAPESRGILSVLGQFYWYADERLACIENFAALRRLDPDDETAMQYWDLLFFVPEGFRVPERLVTDKFVIRPLRAADAELDYRAVMDSRERLLGVFGPDSDWPAPDLTLEADRRALANHEREHQQRSAFTYTVMDRAESEVLGCVYIMPVHSDDYDVQVVYWVTEQAARKGGEAELGAELEAWLASAWPFVSVLFPGRNMDWETYNRLYG